MFVCTFHFLLSHSEYMSSFFSLASHFSSLSSTLCNPEISLLDPIFVRQSPLCETTHVSVPYKFLWCPPWLISFLDNYFLVFFVGRLTTPWAWETGLCVSCVWSALAVLFPCHRDPHGLCPTGGHSFGSKIWYILINIFSSENRLVTLSKEPIDILRDVSTVSVKITPDFHCRQVALAQERATCGPLTLGVFSMETGNGDGSGNKSIWAVDEISFVRDKWSLKKAASNFEFTRHVFL